IRPPQPAPATSIPSAQSWRLRAALADVRRAGGRFLQPDPFGEAFVFLEDDLQDRADHIVAVAFHVLAGAIQFHDDRLFELDVDAFFGRFVLLRDAEFHRSLLIITFESNRRGRERPPKAETSTAGAGFGRAEPPKTGVVPAHATSLRSARLCR